MENVSWLLAQRYCKWCKLHGHTEEFCSLRNELHSRIKEQGKWSAYLKLKSTVEGNKEVGDKRLGALGANLEATVV